MTANTGTLGTIGVNIGINSVLLENKNIDNVVIAPVYTTISGELFENIGRKYGFNDVGVSVFKEGGAAFLEGIRNSSKEKDIEK